MVSKWIIHIGYLEVCPVSLLAVEAYRLKNIEAPTFLDNRYIDGGESFSLKQQLSSPFRKKHNEI
jgi:hypothetical protein